MMTSIYSRTSIYRASRGKGKRHGKWRGTVNRISPEFDLKHGHVNQLSQNYFNLSIQFHDGMLVESQGRSCENLLSVQSWAIE